jgi:hypothetical protein
MMCLSEHRTDAFGRAGNSSCFGNLAGVGSSRNRALFCDPAD